MKSHEVNVFSQLKAHQNKILVPGGNLKLCWFRNDQVDIIRTPEKSHNIIII